VSSKAQILQALKQQNESSINVIRNMAKENPSRFMYEIVLSLVDEIEFVPTLKVREIMYNKEANPMMGVPG